MELNCLLLGSLIKVGLCHISEMTVDEMNLPNYIIYKDRSVLTTDVEFAENDPKGNWIVSNIKM